MIIAVSAEKHGPRLIVPPCFGKSGCFVFVNMENDFQTVVENPYAGLLGDAGIQSTQMLIARNVDAVIADRIGRNSFRILSAAKIKAYHSSRRSAGEAIALFLEGRLQAPEMPEMAECSRHRKRYRNGGGTNSHSNSKRKEEQP